MVYASYYSKELISDFIRKFLTKLKENNKRISQFLPQVPSKYEEQEIYNTLLKKWKRYYLKNLINLTGTSKAIYAINSSNLRSDEILSYEFPEKRKRSSNGSSRTAWRFRIIKKDFLSGAMNNFLSSP
ncbi:hypothetical protein RIR_jg27933.t1 [Rhizophagus irregularis DAOM 181602=DAOM 197198]|nr:hypothetical protein RIR_jg27933.t1 [Rhizophagus irregularis DAOM 181602=DAOM 197198]